MGLYDEILHPAVFMRRAIGTIETADAEISSGPITAIVIGTGSRKAQWLGPLFSDLGVPINIREPKWREDEYTGYLSPAKIACWKAVSSLDLGETTDISGKDGIKAAFSTDVDLINSLGEKMGKPPKEFSPAEIEQLMNQKLGGQEDLQFTARVSMAIYGRHNKLKDQGVGLSTLTGHTFMVKPFSPAEIEFYIYGFKGRDGSYPKHVASVFKYLEAKYALTEAELNRLRSGFEAQELGLTNLACRWPHPLMQDHIMVVNGVERSSLFFDKKLLSLYLTLLGAPAEGRNFLKQYRSFYQQCDNPGKSLYPELTGIWGQVMKLKSGKHVLITNITSADHQEISELVCRNFAESENYKSLRDSRPEVIAGYLEANSVAGIADTCGKNRNISCLVSRDETGKVVGYRVVRAQEHPKTGEIVAHGRRLHISIELSSDGLGKQLMELSEQMAKEAGFNTMVVQPSGESVSYFQKLGYKPIFDNPVNNGELSEKGLEVPVVYMDKIL